ncbi:MAG: radical SAM-associated putative lipoprotein [Prevotellaceae bacterium]|jgi:putative lipoprotein (rSAM/lipoprotein system)|nr:radical SAM-associated putative lipoprotein [Prevotellaceae bacterium]
MKKINHSILKGFNWLLLTFLGLIGFTNHSCMTKYGSPEPEADFVVKGKVVEKNANQKPIKNISVQHLWQNAAVFTNEQGDFILPTINEFPRTTLTIIATDIDGAENGEYLTDTVYLDMSDAQKTKKGDGEWYRGEFTKSVTIELTPKE